MAGEKRGVPEAFNSFEKGLQKDASVIGQPEGTYRDALNITLSNDSGEAYAMCNEKGTTQYAAIPDGYSIIGSTVVDDNVIVCLANPTTSFSQIGIIKNGGYTQKIPLSGEDGTLGFDINYPIDIVGRKLFNGDTIVYLTDNNQPISVLNLDDPAKNISKGKGIIPDIELPVITIEEIVTGGNLTGGVVQFMVRYLNKELVPTITTPPTTPLPILGSSPSSSTITSPSDVFGAGYDEFVNKAVKVKITNLDTDYPYFELIAISYEGGTSAPKALIAGTYDITSSSRDIIYSGETEDSVLTTVDEVIVDPITYDKAKCVEQKDGRLFFTNLTESKSRYKDALQEVANNIVVEYTTVSREANFYADPLNCIDEKSYHRGEVYSLGIGVIFKDGTTSFVYHIPGRYVSNTPNFYRTTTPNSLGSYVSEELYPANQGYPQEAGNGNTHVRHHIMPTLREEPSFVGTTTINQLKLRFNNINIPLDIQEDIQEIILFREPRNSPEKRSKLSQGVVTDIYLGASEYQDVTPPNVSDSSGNKVGDAVNNSYHFRKNFGFFNATVNTFYDFDAFFSGSSYGSISQVAGSKLSSHHGFYYSNITLDRTLYGRFVDSGSGWTSFDRDAYQNPLNLSTTDKLCFMSPEVLLSDGSFLNISSLKGGGLQKVLELGVSGTPYYQDTITGTFDADFDTTNSKTFIDKASSLNVYYNVTSVLSDYGITPPEHTIEDAVLISNGERLKLPGLTSYNFDNDWSEQTLYLRLSGEHQQNAASKGNFVNPEYPRDTLIGGWANMHLGRAVPDGVGNMVAVIDTWAYNLDLYELVNYIRNQYGKIENSQYAPIYRTKNLTPTTPSTLSVGGGDVFITRYTQYNRNLFNRYFPVLKNISNNIEYFKEYFDNDVDSKIYTQTRIFQSLYSPAAIPGVVWGSAVEYFVESVINTYFRYMGEDGIPYSPLSSRTEVFSAIPNQEGNRNYNVQYSFDNTIKTSYVSRPIFDEAITSYPNRTIYSERSNEDSKVDEYQIFKQNSFYDLPEDDGAVIDTFVWNNELFSHTTKGLWRNFVNTTTQEATTIGEVVYGSGGLFSLPSKKVLTSEGGYGGTLSQFGNAITPFGYFFVDTLQRKVFKLTDGLEEISMQGMLQFFDNNLRIEVDNTFNPNNSTGITVGWDNEYKRLLLTQKGSNPFTISYYPINQAWVSFHSYQPNTYISYDKFLYSIINNTITPTSFHLHNTGNYGVYHNNPIQECNITIVSNAGAQAQKVFDNFEVHSRSYDTGNYIDEDTFNTIHCKTLYLDSGVLNVNATNVFNTTPANNEVLCRWKKSHYQIAIPRDNQEVNLSTPNGWKDASRMKGKYLLTTFTYSNLNNREFIVNFIKYLFRIIAR